MLLIDKLRSKENLTTTEKKIVNYILDNLDEIPAMSVEQLAKKSFSSHSAIVRLSKKLGFAGYKEFRLELSKTIQARIFQPEDVDANFPFKREDDSMMIAKKLADLSVSTIKRSYAQLNKEQLDKAGRMLWSAERIFLFGQGDSQIRARSFQNKLVKIDKFAMIGEEYADEDWVAVNLSPKDCAVFISYGGKSKQSQKIIKFFSQKKVPTLLISGNINSPMIDFADL
ncbi:RpiR family transcriptional regulator, partial [Oenococcus alcoholitolerans]